MKTIIIAISFLAFSLPVLAGTTTGYGSGWGKQQACSSAKSDIYRAYGSDRVQKMHACQCDEGTEKGDDKLYYECSIDAKVKSWD